MPCRDSADVPWPFLTIQRRVLIAKLMMIHLIMQEKIANLGCERSGTFDVELDVSNHAGAWLSQPLE